MKKVVFLLISASLFACSSPEKSATSNSDTKKAETTSNQPPPAAPEKAAGKAQKSATSATSASDAEKKVVCKAGNDTRELSLVKSQSGGCETHYNKFGKSDVVATAKVGTSHCEGILTRIKDKLVESQFTCE
ncbi:MAG: hypothetical protein IPJ71_04520 [Bdellovibrionales bacterium]|nr:hypothetical protein [Bdellovibrionales bacterium]